MRLQILVGCVVLAMTATRVFAEQKLVAAQSQISFTSKQMAVPVEGKFRKFTAEVEFEPKRPEAAKIALTIDLASASLGSSETEAELAQPSWFNSKVFPQATFRSTVVTATGAGRFNVAGKLLIKSISRDVLVPISLVQSAGQTTASGKFSIKRLDFRIGDGEWKDTSIVADVVEVNFNLVLTGIGPL